MQKVILMSIVALSIVLPTVVAREADARRAVRKLVIGTIIGICIYLAAVILAYPRFLG